MGGTRSLIDRLFQPVDLGKIRLANRIVMPPMGVHRANDGVPKLGTAEYYRQRALGGVGLMFTEGSAIDHAKAAYDPSLLNFATEAALSGWQEVVRQVHEVGGRIMPQLWHAGLMDPVNVLANGEFVYDAKKGLIGPSGLMMPGRQVAPEMSVAEINVIIDAFARAAVHAQRLGFDGVEIHGAHGYLLDQFFWEPLNRRSDAYGGSQRNRSRFAAEIIAEIRHRVGSDFPIVLRISQWKLHDYDAQVARNPSELDEWLLPLVDAGVDLFDCSQRRYWLPEFEGSPLNFSGWVRKITGRPTISVGSVGLTRDVTESFAGVLDGGREALDRAAEMLAEGQFDLLAVGRGQLADPQWCRKVRDDRAKELIPFHASMLAELADEAAA